MCCKNFRIIIFPASLIIVFFVSNVFGQCKSESNPIGRSETGLAIDAPYNSNSEIEEKPKIYPKETKPLQITSKPIAKYTDEAKKNCVEGVVLLKITFFSNGNVGNIKVLEGLPFGLSEQAVEAAKLIKFEPAMKRGKNITVTKRVRYNFTIY